jgi:hypothetical protein
MTYSGMDITATYNGTDITTYLTAYKRSVNICTGVGTLDIELNRNCPLTFIPWGTVVVWEEGTKRGTFHVSEIREDAPSGIKTLVCQDGSKRLQEWY